jgi:hypothetical protein
MTLLPACKLKVCDRLAGGARVHALGLEGDKGFKKIVQAYPAEQRLM